MVAQKAVFKQFYTRYEHFYNLKLLHWLPMSFKQNPDTYHSKNHRCYFNCATFPCSNCLDCHFYRVFVNGETRMKMVVVDTKRNTFIHCSLGAIPRTGFSPVDPHLCLLISHHGSILPAQNSPGVFSTNFKCLLDALSAFQRNDPPGEEDTWLVMEY